MYDNGRGTFTGSRVQGITNTFTNEKNGGEGGGIGGDGKIESVDRKNFEILFLLGNHFWILKEIERNEMLIWGFEDWINVIMEIIYTNVDLRERI